MRPTPDESFVPLTPGALPAHEHSDFRVNVKSNVENAQPFHPLGFPGAASPLAPNPNAEPQIEIRRDGDRVSAIHIQCTCGQTIELECHYDSAPALAPVTEPVPPPVTDAPSAPAAVPPPGSAPEPEPNRKSAPKPKSAPAKAPSKKAATRSRR